MVFINLFDDRLNFLGTPRTPFPAQTLQAADIAGIRAILLYAKEEEARAWSASWDFEASVTDSYHLFLLLKDLKSTLDR